MKTLAMPLVSCIMPTANRIKFIPNAITFFLEQDYQNKELIIVDDGTVSIEHLIPKVDSIKYHRLENVAKKNTGEKRNIACELSSGEFIAHFDDDDYYMFDWLSHSMKILRENNADLCGLSQLNYYQIVDKQFWKYTYPTNLKLWVAGATMVYKKTLWKSNPFLSRQIGEDNEFVWKCRGKVISHNYVDGFIATAHSANTSPKRMKSNLWQPIAQNNISSIENFNKYFLI